MQYINRGPSLDEQTFDSIGKGLSQGLQILANQKLQQVQNNQVYNYLKVSNPNMSDQEARAIASMGPQYHEFAIKSAQQAQGNAAMGQYLNAMAGYGQQNPSVDPATSSTGIQNIKAMSDPSNGKIAVAPSNEIASNIQEPQSSMNAAAAKNASMQAGAGIYPVGPNNYAGKPIDFKGLTSNQLLQLAQMGQTIKSSDRKYQQDERKIANQEKQFEQKYGLQERGIAAREKATEGRIAQGEEKIKIAKTEQELRQEERQISENKDYAKDLNERLAQSHEMKKNLTILKEAYEGGELPTPIAYFGMKMFGVNMGDLLSNDAQIAEKASSSLKRNMVKSLGGKVLKSETDWISKSVPTLLNDPKTGSKLVDILMRGVDETELEASLYNDLVEKNNGVPPRNAHARIYNSPEMKDLRKHDIIDIKQLMRNQPNSYDNLYDIPKPKSFIVWDKKCHSMGDLEHEFGRQWEAIAFYPGENHKFKRRPVDIIRCAKVSPEKLTHPNEKPVSMWRPILESHDGSVLDPFMGSGAILGACKELKRNGIGIEISEKYCATAKKRLQNTQVPFI